MPSLHPPKSPLVLHDVVAVGLTGFGVGAGVAVGDTVSELNV